MLLIYDQLRTSVLKEAVELDDGQKQNEHKELKLKIFPLSENLWMKSWTWLSLTLQDAIVGLSGVTGVSKEQRKRLNVAVELVANPSIVFMDEPTSGLDARAAAIVMRTARITADTGRTVVCIFESFDELLLLKRGGQIIYSGPLAQESHKIIEYSKSIPGVPKIMDKYNPARWMLEASSIATEVRLGVDFADLYKSSSLYKWP